MLTDSRLLWFLEKSQRCSGCGKQRAFALYRYGDKALPVCEPCKEALGR